MIRHHRQMALFGGCDDGLCAFVRVREWLVPAFCNQVLCATVAAGSKYCVDRREWARPLALWAPVPTVAIASPIDDHDLLCQGAHEARFIYDEVFVDHVYEQCGVQVGRYDCGFEVSCWGLVPPVLRHKDAMVAFVACFAGVVGAPAADSRRWCDTGRRSKRRSVLAPCRASERLANRQRLKVWPCFGLWERWQRMRGPFSSSPRASVCL